MSQNLYSIADLTEELGLPGRNGDEPIMTAKVFSRATMDGMIAVYRDSLYSIADLTEELGLPADQVSAVAAFTGEIEGVTAKVFSRAWMDEMIEVLKNTSDHNAD